MDKSAANNKLWYIKGGPKNNGMFAYFENGKMRMGNNHKPMTKNARTRKFFHPIQKGRNVA